MTGHIDNQIALKELSYSNIIVTGHREQRALRKLAHSRPTTSAVLPITDPHSA